MTTATLAAPAVLRELVIANRVLADHGVLDAFGHVSIRHPEQPDRFIISRSRGPELVTEDDLQLYTLTCEQVAGNPQPGYAERAIHGAIYEARPDVQAICHNHSPSTIPFGVTGVPLRPIFHMAGLIGADIPVWDIAREFGDTDLLVRTMEQGRSLARTVGPRRVTLMRGHGSVVPASSLREAVVAAIFMEQNARMQMQALALGQPIRYLTPGEVEQTGQMLTSSLASDRAWLTWAARVGFPEG